MTSQSQDRPQLGILLMVAFCIAAPLADTVAKSLTSLFPLLMLVTIRFAAQALLLTPMSARNFRALRWSRSLVSMTFLRAIFHIGGIWMMVASLRVLPLADALAIAFVMPFIMLLLGWAFLNERIGAHRIGACIVGFFGTLLVVQPSFLQVGWAALMPLGVAVFFALYMLVTRHLARSMDPITLQALNGWQALILLACIMVFTGFEGWRWPVGAEWIPVIALGLIGTISHILMTWSLRLAPSATVAPISYLEIPFAAALGWFVFADWPNPMAQAGIFLIIVAGLYILWRENRTDPT